jgi:membrane-associated protease RseP (regulator of RpoE activity)
MRRAHRRLAPAAALALAAWIAPAASADPVTDPIGGSRIGVHVQSMTPELRTHFEAPPDRGLLVTRVEPGRPAERAGIAVGDVILEAGGVAQRSTWDLVRVVSRAPAGEKLEIRLVRRGKARTVEVVPEGGAVTLPDPGSIVELLERGLQMGSEELREQLRELERRLEELEKRMEEEKAIREGAERT